MSVTLTPPLQEAPERLRSKGMSPSVAELALAGTCDLLAAVDAREADEQRRRELRQRLVRRLRSGDALDIDSLRDVRERAWTRA